MSVTALSVRVLSAPATRLQSLVSIIALVLLLSPGSLPAQFGRKEDDIRVKNRIADSLERIRTDSLMKATWPCQASGWWKTNGDLPDDEYVVILRSLLANDSPSGFDLIVTRLLNRAQGPGFLSCTKDRNRERNYWSRVQFTYDRLIREDFEFSNSFVSRPDDIPGDCDGTINVWRREVHLDSLNGREYRHETDAPIEYERADFRFGSWYSNVDGAVILSFVPGTDEAEAVLAAHGREVTMFDGSVVEDRAPSSVPSIDVPTLNLGSALTAGIMLYQASCRGTLEEAKLDLLADLARKRLLGVDSLLIKQ